MPYHADLRCSYMKAQLNMSWFYQAMEDMDKEVEFDVPASHKDTEDENIRKAIVELTQKKFEEHIEKCFQVWVVNKVFNHNITGECLKSYDDNVWLYLEDMAFDYAKENDGVSIRCTCEDD